jgi:hypothetical protein
MSLPASPWDRLPEQTMPVARAALPTGKPSRRRRAARGPLAPPPTWAALCAPPGRPAAAPAPLALLSVRPWAAGRADAQAADAVRARRAGPAACARPGTAPGGEAAGRRASRQRLLPGPAALRRCERRWPRWRARGRRHAPGRPRTEAPQVLAACQPRPRLAGGGETRRPARHVLATAAPAGRPAWGPVPWCARSRQRWADERRPPRAVGPRRSGPPWRAARAPGQPDAAAGGAAAGLGASAGPAGARAPRS